MAEPLLSLRGVDLALPDLARRPFLGRTPLKAILQGVDLDVAAGESVGLVGESGSGKSTLARTALRLHEPQAGRILFAGKDITHADEVEVKPLRERMQMIFQDPMSSLNPRRRIGEIVAQPLRVAGREAGVATVARLLAQVQLPADFARRYPHELSGGQRQRVGIARAIALAPALIVADEIVSGLDVSRCSSSLTTCRWCACCAIGLSCCAMVGSSRQRRSRSCSPARRAATAALCWMRYRCPMSIRTGSTWRLAKRRQR